LSDVLAGYREGERLARLSSITLAAIGVFELIVGAFTGSIGLTADGIDSMSDAAVSLLVWFGLRISRKPPTTNFRFGYYKVESLVSLFASIGLIAIAGGILYRSYLGFLDPKPLELPVLALAVLLVAGMVSLYRALQMRRVAKKYGLSSLRLDANNGIKDSFASFLVFFTVLASSLGFHQMDAIGGVAVAIFIITVAYVVLKESALMLLDSYHDPSTVEMVRESIGVHDRVIVKDVLIRPVGPLLFCEIHLDADRDMTVGELDEITRAIEGSVQKKLSAIQRVVVTTRARP
jgi:cation diffusion facilitator family transporter